jgi:hypothetical protein
MCDYVTGNYASVYTANGNSSGFSESRIDCRIGTPKKLWFTTSALTDIAILVRPFPSIKHGERQVQWLSSPLSYFRYLRDAERVSVPDSGMSRP